MVKRIITGLLLFGLVFLFTFLTSLNSYAMDALVMVFTAISALEMFLALKNPNLEKIGKLKNLFNTRVEGDNTTFNISIIPIIVSIICVYPLVYFLSYGGLIINFFISFLVLFIIFIFKPQINIKDFLANLFVLIYPLVTNSVALILLHEYGIIPFIFALAISAFSDTFAYFIGSFLGKKKIFPKISPKKTYAGCIGGLIGGAVGGIAVYLLFELAKFPSNIVFKISDYVNGSIGLSILIYACIGFVLAIFSEIGDLAASRIKREVGIKDYSKLLGSHGGFMDRIDSFQFTFILMVFVVTIFGFFPVSIS
ncbi:MAG: phosphatidate cytidylyltransferase [Clostridia bacterium]|nr:phosphatidate cytidylyltransferase [Clostridia bacterium]